MSLNIKDALRIEEYMPPSRINTNRKPLFIYVFKCKTCKNEARSYKHYLNKHSGLCYFCNAKKLLPKALEKRRKRDKEALYNRLVDSSNIRNKNNKIISYEEFLEFTKINKCHYCNKNVIWTSKSTYNLDRKNNDLGYFKDNLVVCCGPCNKTKGDRFTYEEFLQLSPILKDIQNKRNLY